MNVLGKTQIKKLILEVTNNKITNLEIQSKIARRRILRLEEELDCLKNFKFKAGKNE